MIGLGTATSVTVSDAPATGGEGGRVGRDGEDTCTWLGRSRSSARWRYYKTPALNTPAATSVSVADSYVPLALIRSVEFHAADRPAGIRSRCAERGARAGDDGGRADREELMTGVGVIVPVKPDMSSASLVDDRRAEAGDEVVTDAAEKPSAAAGDVVEAAVGRA